MYCCREFQKYKITEKSNYWLVSLESSKSWELENGDICSVCMNYRTRRIWGNHSLESMFLVSGITQEHSTLLVLTGPGFNLRREKKTEEGREARGRGGEKEVGRDQQSKEISRQCPDSKGAALEGKCPSSNNSPIFLRVYKKQFVLNSDRKTRLVTNSIMGLPQIDKVNKHQ